jgi:hypothetical protein
MADGFSLIPNCPGCSEEIEEAEYRLAHIYSMGVSLDSILPPSLLQVPS